MEFDDDRDIVKLMMGPLQLPGVDNFGKDNTPRRSLLLDTVMQGRPRASSCELVQLPAEILADIVDLLSDDKTSLGSLALANSDCRQLARCGQFAEVNFDYSLQARQLASHLVQENSSQLLKPGIGACIRRVTFASHPHHFTQTHRELYDALDGPDSESITDKQLYFLYHQVGAEYVAARAVAVEAISSLPNLESLSWKDQYSLDGDFFRKITRCSVQHIDLDRPVIDDAWSLTPPLTPSVWPLRSLKLHVSLAQDKWNEIREKGETDTHHMTSFFSTLFRLCSQTLESLTWMYLNDTRQEGVPVSIGDRTVSFPRLRYLRTNFVKLDSVGISSLLKSPLRSLDLDHMVLQNPSVFNCEPLQDLEDFVVSFAPRDISACKRIAKFILQHTGLRRLYLHEASAAMEGVPYLDDVIMPILNSCDFGSLRSLHLTWGEPQIPTNSLKMIGRLVSLEQLSLSAGKSYGPQHYWLVDHEKLRRGLRRLQRLTKLAIVQDTYPAPVPQLPDELYYEFRVPGPGSMGDVTARPELDVDEDDRRPIEVEALWERMHRNRMLNQAEKYAAIFPKLEWMFCGQRPMGFIQAAEGQCELRQAIPLTKGRDQCRTYLGEMFRGSE
ncbi:uncharacterized protein FPRO_05606 [Fusarium proliferatum ET1]|uniref:F-box domain-containing protein n=1 Tax=Fusarium proliferatum (strain ET1) TaxID=1227346 RepID=A0A1L7VG25_FUSPR|nr:uncharacterized protein FPRO_05606 [Fusarium proliferatum ET1]CZR39202.1 uncharacterized protein FPRO_05606 [Fusarium proliferatum ET1]